MLSWVRHTLCRCILASILLLQPNLEYTCAKHDGLLHTFFASWQTFTLCHTGYVCCAIPGMYMYAVPYRVCMPYHTGYVRRAISGMYAMPYWVGMPCYTRYVRRAILGMYAMSFEFLLWWYCTVLLDSKSPQGTSNHGYARTAHVHRSVMRALITYCV